MAGKELDRLKSEGLAIARGRAAYKKGRMAAIEGHQGWVREGKYDMPPSPNTMPSDLTLLKQTDGTLIDPNNPDWEDAAEAFRQRIGMYYKIRSGIPEDVVGRATGTIATVIKRPHWTRSEASYGLKESDPAGHSMSTNVSQWDETLGWLEQKAFKQRESLKREALDDMTQEEFRIDRESPLQRKARLSEEDDEKLLQELMTPSQ